MLDFGFYNEDCMKGMKEFPDKYFDLAIVDPPYGDGGVNGQDGKDSVKGSTVTDHLRSCQRKAEKQRRMSSEMGGVARQGQVQPRSIGKAPTAKRRTEHGSYRSGDCKTNRRDNTKKS